MIRDRYTELRALAARKLARHSPYPAPSPTSLVHDVYTRLMGKQGVDYANDNEFFIIAAVSMRDILVERARHNATLKAGGDRKRVPLDDVGVAVEADDQTLLDLDRLILDVKNEDPTDYQLLMLRFYGGLTEAQAAEVMGLSLRTLQRRWQYLRARLYGAMTRGDTSQSTL